jgi:hypothetical protein
MKASTTSVENLSFPIFRHIFAVFPLFTNTHFMTENYRFKKENFFPSFEAVCLYLLLK